ncbi:MAG: multiprotein-bridging factor 1 family protein [archaeon]|jgi:putative transcription factor|nr:multiprotein-bridging factor 1 family protein [archaeon]
MQCEICGRETDRPAKIVVDGSHLEVCSACSTAGKREEPVSFQRQTVRPIKPKSLLELGEDLSPEFGKKIMQGRQKKGLTIEDLGKLVFEKASHLHRIESQAVDPSPKLIAKLEKALEITLSGED